MFTLSIEDAAGEIADEYSFEEGEFIVGRSHAGDIILPSENVSRRHARLYTKGGRCFVEDLASANGLFVDGQRIHGAFEIVGRARIKVGDYFLHVETPAAAPAAAPASRDYGDTGLGTPSDEAMIYGRLVGVSEPVIAKPYDLVRSMTLIGRGKDSAITIVDASMSRVHAKLGIDGDGLLFAEDLRSSNGTYVNDTRISKQTLAHGDYVRFGNVEFILELPGMEDADVVEVSSGGRKGLIFLIVFLVLCLIGGATTLFLYRDQIFGAEEVASGPSSEEIEAQKATEEAERKERYEEAERDVDRIIEKAELLAGKDRWDDALKALVDGAQLLERIGRLDEKGELNSRFSAAEADLREGRREFDTVMDAIAASDYEAAGRAFKSLMKRQGPLLKLAKTKIKPKKEALVAAAEIFCKEKRLDKCLEFYEKAAKLDPTDDAVSKKVKATKKLLATPPPE
ncbi:MAG: pSer/pThr/pTyr-binding forkhead associated (FHA) protein [Myxococcota bacterium]|jgi:pSer/pThr/pTyr-binding forkhead associated (FHA) protein